MGLPKEIADLIERFDRNRESYLSGQYNETQLRREFLDPFFSVLGWDVENKQGYAEAYKDVIHRGTLQRQIDATDQQIDQLVYELYGLTKEEIQVVEAQA